MFLYTLAYHQKNKTIGDYFLKSRGSGRCFIAVLNLHPHVFKKPIPIKEACEDERWKLFKDCLGALMAHLLLFTCLLRLEENVGQGRVILP